MRRGEIQVDWIIAFFIFVIFLSWSFQYYSTLFRYRGTPLDQVAVGINGIIIDNITSAVYDTPASYKSPDGTTSVMYAYHYWTSGGETNTTMVLSNTSQQLQCKTSGDIVYWRSDVIAGENNFTIRVSNRSANESNCSGTFGTANANLTIPHAGDMKVMLSQAAIDRMTATNYDDFKAGNGINRDFRIMLDVAGGGTTAYGSVPPNTSNVFSEENWYKIEETSGDVKITTLIW
jgi:hypothetical protein